MDKKQNGKNWVGNMFHTFEAMCQEVEDFVKKDTVKYVEDHVQTVGKSVKKFYADVIQDILPPAVDPVKHVPSKKTVKSSVVDTEKTIESNTNKPENDVLSPLVPAEDCHKPLVTALCDSEQISPAVSELPVGEADADVDIIQEGDKYVEENSDENDNDENSSMHEDSSQGCFDENCNDDPAARILRESSKDHLDDGCEKQGIISNPLYEDTYCGLNSGTEEKIEDGSTETLVQEEKTLDEFEWDSNTSSALGLFEPESSIFAVSSNGPSSSECLPVFDDDNNDNDNIIITELAFSNYALSKGTAKTDEAVLATGLLRSVNEQCFNFAHFEASASGSNIALTEKDLSTVDIEDLKMDSIDLSDKKQLVQSCVIVEGDKYYEFSRMSRSKSYKKIIRDAFSSRKRIAKEYEQLAIWNGDIFEEFIESLETAALPTTNYTRSVSRVQDSHDSGWELV